MKFRPGSKPDADVPEEDVLDEAPTPVVRPTGEPGKRLGDLLMKHGSVTADDLQQALLEQDESGARLGDVLLELGYIDEIDLLRALSEQSGLAVVDLRRIAPSSEALEALPETIVRSMLALPTEIDDTTLTVAMGAPASVEQLAELTRVSERQIAVVLAPRAQVQLLVDRSYRALSGLDHLVDAFGGGAITDGIEISTATSVTGVDETSPVAQLITRILVQAVRERASDIHLEPNDQNVRVRYRVDGALHDAVTLPITMAGALVSRIKIMADMNIVERRRSQDGQFEITVDNRQLDVRVGTMATIWGEKVVMRVLDRQRSLFELSDLGMAAETRDAFSKLVRSPFGMVICAGPTGSGKTTTLYAVLHQIADSERNITTIEDPVEYVLPTINQIQINEQADITFAGGLKAILRQDPDVILVGEMRDVETARIAVQSALTGHLVFSTLHATDSTSALHRFLDMGIESFLVASSVIGVLAQRLVRRICDGCREPYELTPDERAFYEEWGGKPKDEFTRGVGCNFCSHTGYVDRVGVYELLPVDATMRELIVRRATNDEMREAATEQGMSTLRDEALRMIENDVTTVAEVIRSVYIG